jgi:hypothetical protein
VFREPREAGDWIFRRDRRIRRALATAVDHDPTGIPYLVPELVLLYKAREPREKDEADFGLATGTFTHAGAVARRCPSGDRARPPVDQAPR